MCAFQSVGSRPAERTVQPMKSMTRVYLEHVREKVEENFIRTHHVLPYLTVSVSLSWRPS